MPTGNTSLTNKSRFFLHLNAKRREAIRGIIEPFTLEDLYPAIEYQDENGEWREKKSILPHQKKFHDRLTPNGKRANFILFNGGVGCVGGETMLAGRPIADWVRDGTGPDSLRTLYGEFAPELPYRKGRARLYRVTTQSGRSVVVTARHRFLTLSGWLPLAALGVGSLIAADGSACDPGASQRARGSTGHYSSGLRPCGELPSPAEVAFRDRWQRLHRLDGGSSAWAADSLLSTGGCESLSENDRREDASQRLCVSGGGVPLPGLRGSPGQSESWTHPLHSDESTLRSGWRGTPRESRDQRECRTSLAESNSPEPALCPGAVQSHADCRSHGTGREPAAARLSGASPPSRYERHAFAERWTPSIGLCQAAPPLASESLLLGTEQERFRDQVPYLDSTSFWEEIVAIAFVREDDFYDLGVPGAEHYSAEGLWHHNSGKSISATTEVVYMARKYPGIKIVCVAPYDYYFDESVWPTWAKVLPFDDPLVTKFNSKERSIKLANGSSIRFHAYDDPEKIKGWEAHIIWIEEASELGDGNTQKAMQIFRALLMRLRAKPASIPRRVYVSQNPKGHNWTWRVFVKDSPHQDDPILTHIPPNADYPKGMTYREFVKEAPNGNDVYYTISAGSTANVTLPTGYVDTMLDNMTDDPLLRNRMVEGGFDPIHSLVYDWPYYSKKTHVVDLETVLRVQGWDFTDERQIPRYLPLFIGIDTAGPNSPWAIEAFVQVPEPYEHMLGIGEVYTKGDTWREIVEKLQALTEGWTNISYFVDPKTANKKEGPNQTSILEFFHQWGIPATTPRLGANKGAVIAHVRNLLKPDPNFEHPYLTDFWDEEKQGYNLGAPRLLYLRDPSYAFTVVRDGKVMVDNSEGIANFFNLKEKEVWRFDGKKPRETKEHEEGLSPQANEKTVDRDDHAQDAEGFTMVGWLPLPVSRTRSKRDRDWDNVPVNRYPAQKRRAGRFGV